MFVWLQMVDTEIYCGVYETCNGWPEWCSQYSDLLWAEQSGVESQWGHDILGLSRPAPKPIQTPVKWVLGLYQDWYGWDVVLNQPPPSSAEVGNGLELYLHFLLVPA